MNKEEIYILEDYIIESERQVRLLENHIDLLELPADMKAMVEATVNMLNGKIQGVKEAKSKKDIKEFIKLKKLLEAKSR